MTSEEAGRFLEERGWVATGFLGFAYIVGPHVNGVTEARGQGRTIEAAVQNAIDTEKGI